MTATLNVDKLAKLPPAPLVEASFAPHSGFDAVHEGLLPGRCRASLTVGNGFFMDDCVPW